MTSVPEFSMSDVLRRSIPEPMSGCWLWEMGYHRQGYGMWPMGRRIQARIGRTWLLAHRVAYEAAFGPIPDGMSVCHRCDNPACVNPDHLFVGTHSDNMRDMRAKGRGGNAPARGEGHGFAKLTEAEVAAIRVDSRVQSEIARAYGVTQSHVSRIRSGAFWKHLRGAA